MRHVRKRWQVHLLEVLALGMTHTEDVDVRDIASLLGGPLSGYSKNEDALPQSKPLGLPLFKCFHAEATQRMILAWQLNVYLPVLSYCVG